MTEDEHPVLTFAPTAGGVDDSACYPAMPSVMISILRCRTGALVIKANLAIAAERVDYPGDIQVIVVDHDSAHSSADLI